MSTSVDITSAINHQLSREQERRLFAAMAMQGALGGVPGSHLLPEQLARDSVAHADALLRELEKQP
ncbi:MAG TPA: hypothetical protein VN612_10455 [Acidobacteriaceae bacterium]|nr:hypothetical protein [Acidobacteriaceae bacterium]